MSTKRRGLGQGLGALIPGTGESSGPSGLAAALRHVPIDSILPNPYQPRTLMEETQLDELASSIREHGIIQPLLVTQMEEGAVGERYRLIAGERRWRAAKRAGLAEVPVVIKEASERDMLELAIVENIQRADLNPLEEAAAYQQMAELAGLTHNDIAERVGKNRSTVTNLLRLLQLPQEVQTFLWENKLAEGHARQLLKLGSAAEMLDAAELFIREKFTVRQAEEWVKRHEQGAAARGERLPATLSLQDRDLERQFTSALGTRVELKRKKKGGSLQIFFNDEEDLQSLYDAIVES